MEASYNWAINWSDIYTHNMNMNIIRFFIQSETKNYTKR
jgi:hypothetical protein